MIKKAFTLIELLVVISIIGLLATLSVISFNSARIKSRDTKRLADVKRVQIALESYYNNVGAYPETLGVTLNNNTGTYVALVSENPRITYLYPIPTPPTPNDGNCSVEDNAYIYTPLDLKQSYELSYCLGSGGLKTVGSTDN